MKSMAQNQLSIEKKWNHGKNAINSVENKSIENVFYGKLLIS